MRLCEFASSIIGLQIAHLTHQIHSICRFTIAMPSIRTPSTFLWHKFGLPLRHVSTLSLASPVVSHDQLIVGAFPMLRWDNHKMPRGEGLEQTHVVRIARCNVELHKVVYTVFGKSSNHLSSRHNLKFRVVPYFSLCVSSQHV